MEKALEVNIRQEVLLETISILRLFTTS